jgi:hypothetical protein
LLAPPWLVFVMCLSSTVVDVDHRAEQRLH